MADVADLIDDPAKLIWRLSVPPSNGANIAQVIKKWTDADIYFDWGGGLIWVGLPPDRGAISTEIRSLIAETGGHATLLRAPDAVRRVTSVFQPQKPGVAALSEKLKENFDPLGILNPGKMLIAES